MNSSSRQWPFREPHGCDGDGCASDLNTWPLHHVYRRGELCRLCCSCILLSDRSLYCCCCFFLVASPSSSHHDNNNNDDDPLLAPPAPTVTCRACRSAVAHVACLYPIPADDFVCPACRAAEEGRLFTYAPPCGEPLDARNSRVILLGSRMALALLQQEAVAARAAADRMAREADEARIRAYRALSIAFDVDTELPSWNVNARRVVVPPPASSPENETDVVDAPPPPPEDHMAAAGGEGVQADVEGTLVVRRGARTIGTGHATAAAPMDDPAGPSSSHMPLGAGEVTVAVAESSSSSTPTRTLNFFGVKEMALAAAEAARPGSPQPEPRMLLQLFPTRSGKARSRPNKKPRTALQLFEDKIPDDDEM